MNHNPMGRQQMLQEEAEAVLAALELLPLLETAGQPVRVGSAALGLMVWRDIDVTVVCEKIDLQVVARIASSLIVREGVRELRFLNDTGAWNTDPLYPDGLYVGFKYVDVHGMEWKMDVWFVDEPDKQPDLQHMKTMPARLTAECREAIVTIKDIWATRVEYGSEVKSFDIYTAVLDDGVRTPLQFQEWLDKRSEQRNEEPDHEDT